MSLARDYRAITDDISIVRTGRRTLGCASLSHGGGGCLPAPDIQADIRPPGGSRQEKEEQPKEKLTAGLAASAQP